MIFNYSKKFTCGCGLNPFHLKISSKLNGLLKLYVRTFPIQVPKSINYDTLIQVERSIHNKLYINKSSI